MIFFVFETDPKNHRTLKIQAFVHRFLKTTVQIWLWPQDEFVHGFVQLNIIFSFFCSTSS